MDFDSFYNYSNLHTFLKAPLLKNSFFLILTQALNASCGFIFWFIASRLYTIEDVGIATALISSFTIVNYLSRLGINSSLVRYLPISDDKNKVINSYLITTLVFSAIVGAIFVTGINIFSPKLSFIQQLPYSIFFIIFVIFNLAALIIGYCFIAFRDSKQFFYQNVILSLRLPLLPLLVFFKGFGIFATIGLANVLCAMYSFFRLAKEINFDLKIDLAFLKKSLGFSFGNYVSDLLKLIPELILPIMVLNVLGETEAARYYIAYTISSIVMVIPESLTTSLFVEGSNGENLKEGIVKVISTTYLLLLPSVILIYFFGGYILQIFGNSYTAAFELLRLLVISSFFATIHLLFISIQNIRMKIRSFVMLNSIRFVILLGSSYLLMREYGLLGIGYAWLIINALISFGILGFAIRDKWISPLSIPLLRKGL